MKGCRRNGRVQVACFFLISLSCCYTAFPAFAVFLYGPVLRRPSFVRRLLAVHCLSDGRIRSLTRVAPSTGGGCLAVQGEGRGRGRVGDLGPRIVRLQWVPINMFLCRAARTVSEPVYPSISFWHIKTDETVFIIYSRCSYI